MTSSSRDALPVPDEAARELTNLALGFRDEYGVDENVRAIAAPVVAAELRRIAGEFARTDPRAEMLVNRGFRQAANLLTARADELDPQKTEARDG